MKKYLSLTIVILSLSFAFPAFSFAQGMMGFPSSSSNSAALQSQQQEEQEGKQFLDNLNNNTVTCSQLKDADFEKIGEYFMGQSIGDTSRHIAMNEMMKSMMGEQGEEQIHVTWGKRGSGCDTSAAFPSQGAGFMPMMWMVGSAFAPWSFGGTKGGGNPMMGFGGNNIMGGWNGFGLLGWIPILLFWILLILGVVALFRYLGGSTRSDDKEKSSLDILKERYAKGEIGKKEFEQMKKDLA